MSRIIDITTHRHSPAHAPNPEPKERKPPDPKTYCSDLDWFLNAGGAAMSERGTLGGIVNALELGGYPGGVPNTDLYSDAQIGWSKTVIGLVERHRWLMAAWRIIGSRTQGVLVLCYSAPKAAHRSDAGFGARDRWVGETSKATGAATFTGVSDEFERFKALAFALTPHPAKLWEACSSPSSEKSKRAIGSAKMLAKNAAKEAHQVWFSAKSEAQHPRAMSERRKVLPAYVGAEAEAE